MWALLRIAYALCLQAAVGLVRFLQKKVLKTFWTTSLSQMELLDDNARHRLNSTLHPALQTLSYEYHRATGLHRWQARTGSAKHFLLLPGFNQCVLLQYEYLIRFALDQGFSIDVLEYPGHGSKGGQLGDLNGLSADQLCRYVEVALSHVVASASPGSDNRQLCLVAFSMGVALGVEVLQRNELLAKSISRCVFMAPVLLSVHAIMWNTVHVSTPLIATRRWVFDNQEDAVLYEKEVLISRQLPPSPETLTTVHHLCTAARRTLLNKTPKAGHTLFIHGLDDSIMPKRDLDQILPDAQVHWVKGANHSLLFGVPDKIKHEVCQCIVDFCQYELKKEKHD